MTVGPGDGSFGTQSDDAPVERDEEEARQRTVSEAPEDDSVQDAGLPAHEDDASREPHTETGELNP